LRLNIVRAVIINRYNVSPVICNNLADAEKLTRLIGKSNSDRRTSAANMVLSAVLAGGSLAGGVTAPKSTLICWALE
jgi:hypothetical protein